MEINNSKKQFFFLRIDEESKQVWLLGYPVSFSPTEIKILSALCDRRPLSGEDILAEIGSRADKRCLSAHICSINKKAEKENKNVQTERSARFFFTAPPAPAGRRLKAENTKPASEKTSATCHRVPNPAPKHPSKPRRWASTDSRCRKRTEKP